MRHLSRTHAVSVVRHSNDQPADARPAGEYRHDGLFNHHGLAARMQSHRSWCCCAACLSSENPHAALQPQLRLQGRSPRARESPSGRRVSGDTSICRRSMRSAWRGRRRAGVRAGPRLHADFQGGDRKTESRHEEDHGYEVVGTHSRPRATRCAVRVGSTQQAPEHVALAGHVNSNQHRLVGRDGVSLLKAPPVGFGADDVELVAGPLSSRGKPRGITPLVGARGEPHIGRERVESGCSELYAQEHCEYDNALRRHPYVWAP